MSNVYEALQRAGYQVGRDEQVAYRNLLAETGLPSDPGKPIPVTARPGQVRHAIGALFSAIRPMLDSRHASILHIVAATEQEGTSTVARELALVVATGGSSRTLLVDANNQNFGTARLFGCPLDRGLIDCVSLQAPYHGALRPVPNTLLSVGRLSNDLAPIETETLRSLYKKAREEFGVTIVDCPPIERGGYSELLPELADGIILVIRAEKVKRGAVMRATDLLQRTGGNIVGAVFNMQRNYVPQFLG